MKGAKGLPARLRRQDGYVALELALATGLLVLPLTIMVLTFPTWIERQSLARSSAQEAARTVVLADSWDQGTAKATALVGQMAAGYGLSADDVSVRFTGSLERGAAVTATVTVTVPAANLPFIASVGSWSLSGSDTEKVDQYRSFP
jgi:hypothetical protein